MPRLFTVKEDFLISKGKSETKNLNYDIFGIRKTSRKSLRTIR
jgi:hypothetical protein